MSGLRPSELIAAILFAGLLAATVVGLGVACLSSAPPRAPAADLCPACAGTGWDVWLGIALAQAQAIDGMPVVYVPCRECRGSGRKLGFPPTRE
jgi:hypothetical protein